MTLFPFGASVVLLRRQDDGSFAPPETFTHCAVEPRLPRLALEDPTSVWPPISSGKTLYDTSGTLVAAARDRVTVQGVTYEVDGPTEVWVSPYNGATLGTVTYLRRTDNWYDTTIVVKTYLGSGGMGPRFGSPVTWPANVAAVSELSSVPTGDQFASQVTFRVPPSFNSTDALGVFAVGSQVTVSGRISRVMSVRPVVRDGFTEFVEVTAR